MDTYKRLVTFLVSASMLFAPVVAELDMNVEKVIAITFIAALSIFGFNLEEWLRVSALVRQISDALEEVADEMDDVSEQDKAGGA